MATAFFSSQAGGTGARTCVRIRRVKAGGPFLASAASLLSLLSLSAQAQNPAPPAASRGVEVVRAGGYPELRIDGKPFFVHSATFFYYRLPRDLWDSSLDRHRALGINTIDLLIPWNWHEPHDGVWDFDGHTNPRRDLRGLLQLLSEKGFKVIARPGPIIGGDWRHAGYPEWLLAQPEYAMNAASRRAGRAPPLAELAGRNPERAARTWMDNATHIERARRWLRAVAAELAPYGARRTLTVRAQSEKGGFESKPISGPLILVQVGDALPMGAPAGGSDLAQYRNTLREALVEGGLDALFFACGGSLKGSPAGMGTTGEWFPQPPARAGEAVVATLTAQDAAEIEATVEGLKDQALLPPLLLGFQAGWPAPPDDVRPLEAHPASTLLASRLAIAHGARGVNYFPLQDTLTPAGYETPDANRHYRWDAALDVAGNEKPRSRFVARNASMLAVWGERLAATHERADFGIVLPGSAAGRHMAEQVSRVTHLAGLSAEQVDVEAQPVDDLLRHALVILPSPAEPLSEAAQRKLADYASRGGTLAVTGPRPAGQVLAELWKNRPDEAPREGLRSWSIGQGRVTEAPDFFTWVVIEEDFLQTRMRGEEAGAIQILQRLMNVAGVRPVIRRDPSGAATGELAISQLVSNEGTGPLGTRTGGAGFLMVTNLSADEAGEETIETLSPRSGARSADEPISLPVHIPARESLLLPLHVSLCVTAKPEDRCRDEVIAAGAELLDVRRDGRTLELTLYTPARATVLLRLAQQPRRVILEEFRPEAEWVVEKNELRVRLPRGAWPNFERVLRITLPYSPFLQEPPKEKGHGRDDYGYAVTDAVRLPIGDDVSLPTQPPLIVLDENRNGHVLMQGSNYDELGRTLDFRVEGPAQGSDGMALGGFETRQVVVDLKAAQGSNGDKAGEGLLHGDLEAKSGRDRRKTLLNFVSIPKDGAVVYQFDFDRDGTREWVLENKGLRLIVSPESGGRALALVDKDSGTSLLTSLGGIVDQFGGEAPVAQYAGQWVTDEKGSTLKLVADDPRIEKTMLLDESGLVVDYAWRVDSPESPGSLAIVNSLPVTRGDAGTRLCWKAGEEAKTPETCEPFATGGIRDLPESVRRVEVREPGRPALALEWDTGRMRIEMKRFSALLRLEVPEGTMKNQLRYSVKREEQ